MMQVKHLLIETADVLTGDLFARIGDGEVQRVFDIFIERILRDRPREPGDDLSVEDVGVQDDRFVADAAHALDEPDFFLAAHLQDGSDAGIRVYLFKADDFCAYWLPPRAGHFFLADHARKGE